jgi:hypothetical protein
LVGEKGDVEGSNGGQKEAMKAERESQKGRLKGKAKREG